MKVCFVYAFSPGFSGQMAATNLLLTHLPAEITRRTVALPAFAGGFKAILSYAFSLLRAWSEVLSKARDVDTFYLNAGQSVTSFVRDGICLLIIRCFNRACRVVISLHGNAFMLWGRSSPRSKVFSALCNLADIVTVLGPNQQSALRSLGVRADVRVVDNGSEFKPVSEDTLAQKHGSEPVKILFLGNLLETKGYPIFLEALETSEGAPRCRTIAFPTYV